MTRLSNYLASMQDRDKRCRFQNAPCRLHIIISAHATDSPLSRPNAQIKRLDKMSSLVAGLTYPMRAAPYDAAAETVAVAATGRFGRLLRNRADAARRGLNLGNRGLDRLESFLRDVGVKLADLRRLRHKAFVGDLRIFRLDPDRVVERLGAKKLLKIGRTGLERTLGIIRRLRSNRLQALGERGRHGAHRFELLFAKFLKVLKIRRHSLLL